MDVVDWTKESNARESLGAWNPEADASEDSWGEILTLVAGRIMDQPILLLGRFEEERICWDPKDGELCLNRVKPEKTPVEAWTILTCKSIAKFG